MSEREHTKSDPDREDTPRGADDGGSLGDPRVDAAVSSLRDLDQRHVDEHSDVYERAHELLRQALEDSGSSAGTPSEPG